jgi:hypothetical protein
MALKIKNGKVINISPPKLTKKEYEDMLNAPVDKKMIQESVNMKFNIVSA